MLRYSLYWLVSTFVFWFLFVNVMALKAKAIDPRLSPGVRLGVKIIGYPIAIAGIVYDIAYNWTYGCLMFLERPRGITFTSRLQYHVNGVGWRRKVARFICRYLVEPWDCGHCGMA